MNKLKTKKLVEVIAFILVIFSLQSSSKAKLSNTWTINDKISFLKSLKTSLKTDSLAETALKTGGVSSYHNKLVRIQVRHSGKCLAKSLIRGAEVLQTVCNANDHSQLWIIISLGSSKYQIRHVTQDQVFTIKGSSKSQEADLIHYDWEGGNNQKFYINAQNSTYYSIKNVNSDKCLDVHAYNKNNLYKLTQWTCNSATNQQLKFINASYPNFPRNDKYYIIKNEKHNKCFKYTGCDNKKLIQYTCGTGNEFQFKFTRNLDSTYIIQPKNNSNCAFDVIGYGVNNKTKIQFHGNVHRKKNQRYHLIAYDGGSRYYIRDTNSGKCIDNSGSGSNNAEAWIYLCRHDNQNQIFTLTEVSSTSQSHGLSESKYYRLRSKGTERCISNSKQHGRFAVMGPCNNNDDSQLWKPKKHATDIYSFINPIDSGNGALDLAAYDQDNGAYITVWDYHGGNNQRFKIFNFKSNSFALFNMFSFNFLETADLADTAEFVGVQTFDSWDYKIQEWEFVEGSLKNTFDDETKKYIIKNVKSRKCLMYHKSNILKLYDCVDKADFVFHIRRNLDSSVTIVPVSDITKSLSAKGAGKTTGTYLNWPTGVMKYHQKFFINAFASNTWGFRESNSELCLDLKAGNTNNGAPIHLWGCNSQNQNQQFLIEEAPTLLSDLDLTGYFLIKGKSNGKCLTLHKENYVVRFHYCNEKANSQLWHLRLMGDKFYILTHKTGAVLEVKDSSTNNNKEILAKKITGQANQKFIVRSDENYNIKLHSNLDDTKCLMNKNKSSSEFNQLVLYDCQNTTHQQFELIGAKIPDFPNVDKVYTLRNVSRNKCIVFNSKKSKFKADSCDNVTEKHQFRFIKTDDLNSYFIEAVAMDDQVFDLHGGNVNNDTKFYAWNIHSGTNQRFILQSSGEDSYYIRNFKSDKCIRMNSENTIINWSCGGGDDRKWYIEESGNYWNDIYTEGTATCSG